VLGYGAIQEAITAAANKDLILVGSGTYTLASPIKVNKELTLKGNPDDPTKVVLKAPVAGDDREVLQLLADGITIQGFTIQGSKDVQKGGSWNSNPGIAVGGDKLMLDDKPAGAVEFTFDYWGYAVKNINILDNIIKDNSYGIFLFHSQNVVIKRNDIHSNTRDANTWSGKGIEIFTSVDMADAAKVVGGGDPLPATKNILIEDNKIYDNKLFGIELNHFEDGNGGVAGPFDVDVRIINNQIYNNGGPLDTLGGAFDYMRGISANGNEKNILVKGNEIYNHVSTAGVRFSGANAAIRINNSTDWTIENNNIHGNTRGVYAYGTSADILIKGDNTFKDNAQAIVFKNVDTGEIKAGVTYTDNNVNTWAADGLAPGDVTYIDPL
jgi:parallel beta-helix repeat protein